VKTARSFSDLVADWRAAKSRRRPEATSQAALAIGETLAKTGILAEPSADGKYTTLWQPVPTEGGPPGFAMRKIKNAKSTRAAKPAPQLAAC
jgi:hypothetical protein